MKNSIVPVILAGGSGSRLWPVSRSGYPKQFCKLIGTQSLLQLTIERAANASNAKDILIVTNDAYYFFCKDQIDELNISDDINFHYILEPIGKNTAPAIALASMYVQEHISNKAKLFVMPSDHTIEYSKNSLSKFDQAALFADDDRIILFGVKPTSPETGYGYIKSGSCIVDGFHMIDRFIEKPNLQKAQEYAAEGSYFWNSGMFMLAPDVYLSELKIYSTGIYDPVVKSYVNTEYKREFFRVHKSYAQCKSASIDYEVIEKTNNIIMMALEDDWSDLGCWSSISNAMDSDFNGNVVIGNAVENNCTNTFIRSEGRKIVAVGVSDQVIVSTPDALLVSNKACSQQLKDIVEELKINNDKSSIEHITTYRPWGSYETLAKGENFHVKLIHVKPGGTLSLQLHHHRSEHWVVVSGTADIVSGDKSFKLNRNQSTYIAQETKHRLANPSKEQSLLVIEVQVGDYLGEDDIVRFDDVYGRVASVS